VSGCPVPEAGAQAAQQPAASPAPQNPPADASAHPVAGAAIDPAKMAAPAATKAAPPSSKVYVIGAEDVLKIVIWNNAPMSGSFRCVRMGRSLFRCSET